MRREDRLGSPQFAYPALGSWGQPDDNIGRWPAQVDTITLTAEGRAGDVVGFDPSPLPAGHTPHDRGRPWQAGDLVAGVLGMSPTGQDLWGIGQATGLITRGKVICRVAPGATFKVRGPVYVVPGGSLTGDSTATGATRLLRTEVVEAISWSSGVLISIAGLF